MDNQLNIDDVENNVVDSEDDFDPDATRPEDLDEQRRKVGERSDENGEFRQELTSEDLNLNARDDVSTPLEDEEENE